MQFNRFDGGNTMSGFHHLVPHSKHISCREHQLLLVFVHLLPKYKTLKDVDAIIISVWKLMKYFTVKASMFGTAQTTIGKKTNLKPLKGNPNYHTNISLLVQEAIQNWT